MYEKLGQNKTSYQLKGEDALARGQSVEAAGWFLEGGRLYPGCGTV